MRTPFNSFRTLTRVGGCNPINRFTTTTGAATLRRGISTKPSISTSSTCSSSSLSQSRNASLSTSSAINSISSSSQPPKTKPSSSSNSQQQRTPPPISTSPAVAAAQRAYSTVIETSEDGSIPSSAFVETTTLSNGVRVATESTPGHFSAVGVYIDAGSRLERTWIPGESGVSHLLDRLAFHTTTNRTADQMTTEIERLGGNVMCSSSRETIMYQSSVFNQDVPAVLSILADTITNPIVSPQELDSHRESVGYEIGELWNKPEAILPELLHTTAYKGNTLGNPLLCPKENLQLMTSDHVKNFLRTWYTPDRIVIAGAGMPHKQLVELSEKFFGGLKAQDGALEDTTSSSASSSSSSSSSSKSTNSSPRSSQSSLFSSKSSSSSSATSSNLGSAEFSTAAPLSAQHFDPTNSLVSSISPSMRTAIASAKAQYTGGQSYLSKPDLEFTHVYVAFESVSIHDEDIYTLATLQILLGGGGSFSAGGPGKGMYSRLYSNVLNQYHSVDYCASFHHCYNDSGLFGIAASVQHSFASSIPKVIAHELELLLQPTGRGSVTQNELNRAKNQLKSSLVMALESRLVEVEDLGRQVQVHGYKVSVEEMCEKIDKVTLSQLRKVAARVLKPVVKKSKGVIKSEMPQVLNHGLGNGQTTVVAQGQIEGLGDVRAYLFSRGLGTAPSA